MKMFRIIVWITKMLKLLREISRLLTRQEKFFCLLMVVMMAMGAVLEVLGISLVMPVVALLTNPQLLNSNRFLYRVYVFLNCSSVNNFILVMSCVLIIVYFFKNTFLSFSNYCQLWFVSKKSGDLGRQLFNKYIMAPYRFHLEHNSAELLNNINMIEQISMGVLLPLLMLATEIIIICAIFIFLMFYSPIVTAVLLVVIVLTTLLLYYPLRNYNLKLGEKMRNHGQNVFQYVMQGMDGIKEIKVRNCEDFFSEGYQKNQVEYYKALRMQRFCGDFPRFFIEAFVVMLGMGILAFFVSKGMNSGEVILKISLLAMAMFRLMPSMSRVQYNLARIRHSMCVFDKTYVDLTILESEKKSILNSTPIVFENNILLKNISFRYNERQDYILHDFNLEIPFKSSVALVGQTGCGKTTLVDIILGLLKPLNGEVLVDGGNIQDNLLSWQTQVGYVPQNIFLLDDTIFANVTFGTPENEIDEDRVCECLRISQVLDFVETLPDGLDTTVGENGLRLSGGQRQRIGIARALYHNPEVLILDEATSALDNETEKAFVDALKNLHGKLTIIIIAHRMTTVEHCDKIVKM